MNSRTKWARFLNALHIFILALILIGAYDYQFLTNEEPCPLCMLQRMGMIGIACGQFLNLRFGIRPRNYAIAIFALMMGGAVSLRQIALHICPQFPPFGRPVLGLDLYAWAFVIFTCSLFAIAIMMMLYEKKDDMREHPKMSKFEWTSVAIMALVTFANIISTFVTCGWGAACE